MTLCQLSRWWNWIDTPASGTLGNNPPMAAWEVEYQELAGSIPARLLLYFGTRLRDVIATKDVNETHT